MNEILNNPPPLVRQLTYHKTQTAEYILDRFENPSGAYLVQIGPQNYNEEWYVHYYFVFNDGKREYKTEKIKGSYEYVKSLFKNDLMM
jgi:hypothetical protein